MGRTVRLPPEQLQPFLLEVPTPAAPLEFVELFGNDQPVELEVGFGKGLFLLGAAETHPNVNFMGIEIERKYYLFTANRIAKRALSNVRLICGDARAFLPTYIPEQSLHAVHVYFPDPWWKNRHRKRRLFTDEFAEQCQRALQAGGRLHVVTDVEEYFHVIVEKLNGLAGLQAAPAPEPNQPEHDLDYLTNFDRKYRQEGRPVFRTLYVRE